MVTKKQIAKEIGKDIKNGISRATNSVSYTLAQVACKMTYPIFGNLSYNLQNRLQRKLGREYYNAKEAYVSSQIAGVALPAIVLPWISYPSLCEEGEFVKTGVIFMNMIIGGAIGAYYQEQREKIVKKRGREYGASFVGKIISLPFDGATYAYDAGANYLSNVKTKIEAREKTSRNLEQKAEGGRE